MLRTRISAVQLGADHIFAGTPAQMMVTVGHHYGHVPPVLTRDDLIVTQHYEPLPVTDLIPCAATVLDSNSSCSWTTVPIASRAPSSRS